MPSRLSIAVGICLALVALLAVPIRQKLIVFGVFREIKNIHGIEKLRLIPGTVMCEDLHHEKTTNQLFAACQDDATQHTRWFPPLGVLTDPNAVSGGAIVRVDPATFKSTKLQLEGFDHAFVTHGIDILNDPHDPEILWIFAVNHLPDPGRYKVEPPTSKSPERALIEVFRHVLNSNTAQHVRSVRHPLITMPNDIYADSPSSFYVTNDHKYHEGPLRTWEDLGTQYTSPACNIIHVQLTELTTNDPTSGIRTTVALNSMHNNNGLGRGDPGHPEEVVILDASGGGLVRAKRSLNDAESKKLTWLERIQLDSSLDNPFYYFDDYAVLSNNASGYILPGMAHTSVAIGDFPYNDRPIPSIVWHVRSKDGGPVTFDGQNKWARNILFQDDGKTLRSASGSAMIGIDPAKNGGKKQAWLFVTGFGSLSMVAAKVNL